MSHYRYHTTLSSHEFAVFNMLTDSRSVDKSSPAFFFVMLLFVCVFVILVRNYNTALSSHEFVGFNVLTDSVDKSSPAFFVFMSLFVCVFIILGESRTRLQNCLFMSKIYHHNNKPSVTGLFTKGQNFAADRQTSKIPSTTSGAGQIETNFGKQ